VLLGYAQKLPGWETNWTNLIYPWCPAPASLLVFCPPVPLFVLMTWITATVANEI
jgi:hypothetical protein